jgi:predicted transcriptional regulator
MKATIELDDSVYGEAQAYAEKHGKSVNTVLVEAIADRFPRKPDKEMPGLMSVFGTVDRETVAEVQRIIDEEFSRIG